MQTRGRGGGGGEQRTLFNHRDIQWTPLQSQMQSHKYTLILPHTLGDCSTFALEIVKRQSDMHLHSPLWLSPHIDRLLRG